MTCTLSRRNTINAVNAFGGGCCFLGIKLCKTIIQKYFDDRLFRLFRTTITTHKCCERDRSAVSPLIAQSHMTFSMRMQEFPYYRIQFLLYSIVHTRFFMHIFRMYAHLGISIKRFFYAIFQNAHTNILTEISTDQNMIKDKKGKTKIQYTAMSLCRSRNTGLI